MTSFGYIVGRHVYADGTPIVGAFVEVTPSVALTQNGDALMWDRLGVPIKTNSSGAYRVRVPASDDPAHDPHGVTYLVRVLEGHQPISEVHGVFVPAGQTVQMADLTPRDPTAPTYAAQVTAAQFDALRARVAEVASTAEAGGYPSDMPDLTLLFENGLQ